MVESMSNPRISNEVLSDQIADVKDNLTSLNLKLDGLSAKFVTNEVFDLKISSSETKTDEKIKEVSDRVGILEVAYRNKDTNKIRWKGWIVPAVLYVMGQFLLLYIAGHMGK